MLNAVKSSFKETLIYGLGNVAVKLVGLILIPLYTDPKYFSVNDFGMLALLEICALVLTAFMASALPQSLVRWYWDENHRNNQKGIFFMSMSTQVIVSLVFCILLIPLSSSFSEMIFGNADLEKVLVLVILSSAFQAVNNILNTLMRLQSRSVLYSVSNLAKLVLVLVTTLYLIIHEGMGLEGIFLSQVIGNSVIILMLAGYTIKNSKLFFDMRILASMNAYGFPLLLANISAAALSVIDRFALNSMSVLKSVALYTLAFKLTSVLKLVLADSIKLSVGPMMIRRMYTPDNKRFYSKVLLYSSFLIMFAVVGISAFSYEAIKILADSKEFWGAVKIVPILALSVFFINMKEITVYGLHISKKTKIIGMIVVFSTIASLLLNLLFIPVWDITGAAIATLTTQILYWLACHYFSQKSFFVPYELRKILILLIAGMSLSFLCQMFNDMNLLPRLILKTACFVSFPFVLLLFNFYEKIELQYITGFFRKWSDLSHLGENLKSLKNLKDEV
ncbi:MAG TPA: polysaccharide biosynthesis C-terminal domain-containing protein [Bacteroidales bacterium]|nr:polysaccharide biosynthesis C-terminal domain-containing protein [Bacteroidales bacterium]